MRIAEYNERVIFEKASVRVDEVGNHVNVWEVYFSCFAQIDGESYISSKEKERVGQTVEDVSMSVTVRFCEKTVAIDSVHYRIVFRGEIFDITKVDHLRFGKRSLTFVCRKARR